MIAELTVYVFAVTLALALAALAAEAIADLVDFPKRFVWLGAMAAVLVLCAVRVFTARAALPVLVRDTIRATAGAVPSSLRSQARQAGADFVVVTDLGTSAVENVGPIKTLVVRLRAQKVRAMRRLAPYNQLFILAWALLSLIGLVMLFGSVLRFHRARRRWAPQVLGQTRVMLTDNLGPAVIGLAAYDIVVPAWVLDLPPAQRELILTHEREHVRAHDPRVLFGAFTLAALMPWNLPLWMIVSRLRDAIELDCDARVLDASKPMPEEYGSLLLDVSERSVSTNVPIAALAERASLIGRRIDALTAMSPRHVFVRSIAFGAATLALVLLACVTPAPAGHTPVPTRSVVSAATAPKPSAVTAPTPDSIAVVLARVQTLVTSLRARDAIRARRDTAKRDTANLKARVVPDTQPQRRAPKIDRDALQTLARELYPTLGQPGDSTNLIAIMYDSTGALIWHKAIARAGGIHVLMAGRIGPGSIELGSGPGTSADFADIFPDAPKGYFSEGGLSAISGATLVYVVLGPSRRPQ